MSENEEEKLIIKESERLQEEHPADIAQAVQKHSQEEAIALILKLPVELAAESLEEMPTEVSVPLFKELEQSVASKLIEEMSPEDAVDILQEIDADVREKILSEVSGYRVTEILRLLSYPEDSAGSIMSPEISLLSKDLSVEEAIQKLRKRKEECENLNYVYVVDDVGRLEGVLYMRDLIFSSPKANIRKIMNDEVMTVRVDEDKEAAARLLDKYHYLALPVVDSFNRLLGVITVDSVIDVIQDAASEDLQIMVGAGADETVYTPVASSFKKRLPWLWFNLGAAFVAASVIGLFEDVIAQITILAVFFPVVANQGGNAGAQALAVIIRGIALGEVEVGRSWKVLRREMMLGVLNGVVIGLTAFIVAYLISGSMILGIAIGMAMFINLIVAGLMGAFIPLGLKRIGLDPAQSSAILLTTITDVVGFITYLGLAALLLKFF